MNIIVEKERYLIDVVFLLDESSTVSNDQYNLTLRAVKETVQNLRVKEDGANVGLACYSSNFRKIFDMDYYYSKRRLISHLNEVERAESSGPPNIPNALNRTCQNMFSSRGGDRQTAANFLVILSGSGQSSGTTADIQTAVEFCSGKSIKIISLDEESSSSSSSSSLMEDIAFASAYHFDLTDESDITNIGIDISTLINNSAGCQQGLY